MRGGTGREGKENREKGEEWGGKGRKRGKGKQRVGMAVRKRKGRLKSESYDTERYE